MVCRLISLCIAFLNISAFSQERYQDVLMLQLMLAQPGDVIEIPEGNYSFDEALSLMVDDVTLRGKGMERSILDFAEAPTAEGLHVTSNGVTLENFAIQNTRGDGVKFYACDGVTIRGMRIRWTSEDFGSHGSYGFYPVLSRNILIEGSQVSGALDAGVYVGQSEQVIIRHNEVFENIAGIEVENSENVDVYGNIAHDNTGGILVFNLPNLSRQGLHVRVFQNHLSNNNLENTAPLGNVLSELPSGVGIGVMAYRSVDIFENTFSGNQTSQLIMFSYLSTGRTPNDPNYNPYNGRIFAFDNFILGGGTAPSGGHSRRSRELIEGLSEELGSPMPAFIIDGLTAEPESSVPVLCVDGNFNADRYHILKGERDPELQNCFWPKLPPTELSS